MTASDSRPASEDFAPPSGWTVVRFLVPSLVINGVLPIVLYQALTRNGISTVLALVAGSIFPLGYGLWGWARSRRLDFIAGISLFFLLIGAATSLISGSPRFTLLKESFFTGLFGLVFLGSLLAARPVMFYLAREFVTGGDSERMRRWNDGWQYKGFRHVMRVMTAIWGAMFVADAVIRVALVFILSTAVFLVVSQLLFYTMFIVTFAATIAYSRRAARDN